MAKFVSFKALNDRTAGFRFRVLGQKGLIRRRTKQNNGWNLTVGDCMAKINMGKTTLYIESPATVRALHRFAG